MIAMDTYTLTVYRLREKCLELLSLLQQAVSQENFWLANYWETFKDTSTKEWVWLQLRNDREGDWLIELVHYHMQGDANAAKQAASIFFHLWQDNLNMVGRLNRPYSTSELAALQGFIPNAGNAAIDKTTTQS